MDYGSLWTPNSTSILFNTSTSYPASTERMWKHGTLFEIRGGNHKYFLTTFRTENTGKSKEKMTEKPVEKKTEKPKEKQQSR